MWVEPPGIGSLGSAQGGLDHANAIPKSNSIACFRLDPASKCHRVMVHQKRALVFLELDGLFPVIRLFEHASKRANFSPTDGAGAQQIANLDRTTVD